MKKYIALLIAGFVISLLDFSCSNPKTDLSLEAPKSSSVLDLAKAFEKTNDKPLHDFQIHPEKHTWQELNEYYKSLNKNYSGFALTIAQDRVTKIILSNYSLLQDANPQTKQVGLYYLNRLAHSKLVDASLLSSSLKQAGNSLSVEDKKEYAKIMIERSHQLQTDLKDKIENASIKEAGGRLSTKEYNLFVQKQKEILSKVEKDSEKLNQFL